MREKPQAAYILSDNLHINYNLCNNNGDTIIVCNISYIYYTHILAKCNYICIIPIYTWNKRHVYILQIQIHV